MDRKLYGDSKVLKINKSLPFFSLHLAMPFSCLPVALKMELGFFETSQVANSAHSKCIRGRTVTGLEFSYFQYVFSLPFSNDLVDFVWKRIRRNTKDTVWTRLV
jgi:hypothetical protein